MTPELSNMKHNIFLVYVSLSLDVIGIIKNINHVKDIL